jgi:YVTN family beta-propeller protein
MTTIRVFLLMVFVALPATHAAPATQTHAAPTYVPIAEVPVGGEGGWDYLTLDEATSRLYVAHSTSYAVVDAKANSLAGTIADTPGAHGFAIAPGLGRGFTTNGRENKVGVVDLKTLKVVSRIDAGQGPDAILYATESRHLYVFDHSGKTATVIDPKTEKVVATIALGGEAEFGVEDPSAGRVYVNAEDTSEIVAIDEKTNKVVARWPLAPGEEPTGLAIDREHHRLFASCGNGRGVAVDTANGKVVASWPIGHGADACRYDPELRLVFASCGDGTVTIAHEDSPDAYTIVQTLQTARGARTMTLDPETHRIYLATAELKDGATGTRPTAVPGTFKILVFGPK